MFLSFRMQDKVWIQFIIGTCLINLKKTKRGGIDKIPTASKIDKNQKMLPLLTKIEYINLLIWINPPMVLS